MPLYEYRCLSCKHEFEKIRPFSKADDEALCPECGHISCRILSPFACFSKSADGTSTAIAGSGGSCTGCTATTCGHCH